MVELEELRRGFSARILYGENIGYSIRRFRPLISRTEDQDAEMFLSLLNGTDPDAPSDGVRATELAFDEGRECCRGTLMFDFGRW